METLHTKQARLAEVESQMNELQDIYYKSLLEKQNLERKISQTAARLKRAAKLTTALADEQERWQENIQEFNTQLYNVTGDVFISAACVAYYGAFTNKYRRELVSHWSVHCRQLEIPISEDLTLENVMADPFEIQQWHSEGLPRDQISVENAILATKSHRWPLIIDPQEQANAWIQMKELRNGLKVIKMGDSRLLQVLKNCVQLGIPLLVEDVGQTLDPTLEPILMRQTFQQGGHLMIRLGDSDIQFDKNFRLYLTTKLPNPQYLPEVCTKVTIINFMVTKSGLENQILSDVVRLERPDLENQRNELISRINSDKNQLKSNENRILKLLFESEGNILDNEELINSLNSSKLTSKVIKERLKEAELTEQNIWKAREKYRPVATRGSILYFTVADMSEIDPMYQFSLKYFKQLFNLTIKNTKKSENLDERIKTLISETTNFIYKNVSRALFEKHKLVFSFMSCIEILKHEGKVTGEEWNCFLRGTKAVNKELKNAGLLKPSTWNGAVELSNNFEIFSSLVEDIVSFPVWVNLGDTKIFANPELPESTESEGSPSKLWHQELSSFQKLLFIKVFCEEKTVMAITEFVRENLGEDYVVSHAVDLEVIYEDMKKEIPLVFVLSTGSDPMSSFMRFAKGKNYSDRISAISLGQGQGPLAETLIKQALKTGDWIFLQNCHLAASWMPSMEELIKTNANERDKIHDDFRLFLSSKPSDQFPISVLQNSIKVTNEPPRGIKANVHRALREISTAFFEDHILSERWQKMVFGLCLFHAVIQERKKFGPLGWNLKYEFTESDRECALNNLKIFCSDTIPWDSLIYIVGDKQETMLLMRLILDIQPKVPSRSDGQSNDDIVLDMAKNILSKLSDGLDLKTANSALFKGENTDGVFIHGLYMEGFQWDDKEKCVTDSKPGHIHSPLPIIHLHPAVEVPKKDDVYCCPVYRTALRADGLSSNGLSTNFITSVLLPTTKPQSYWITNGAALLCQLSD
ncbi:dynein heavy chain 5, axonemal-like [Argonauta hians]